jgi:hypothetical protein
MANEPSKAPQSFYFSRRQLCKRWWAWLNEEAALVETVSLTASHDGFGHGRQTYSSLGKKYVVLTFWCIVSKRYTWTDEGYVTIC